MSGSAFSVTRESRKLCGCELWRPFQSPQTPRWCREGPELSSKGTSHDWLQTASACATDPRKTAWVSLDLCTQRSSGFSHRHPGRKERTENPDSLSSFANLPNARSLLLNLRGLCIERGIARVPDRHYALQWMFLAPGPFDRLEPRGSTGGTMEPIRSSRRQLLGRRWRRHCPCPAQPAPPAPRAARISTCIRTWEQPGTATRR